MASGAQVYISEWTTSYSDWAYQSAPQFGEYSFRVGAARGRAMACAVGVSQKRRTVDACSTPSIVA